MADGEKRRWSYAAKGLVLFLPKTRMTVVPYEQVSTGGWNCVVVDPGPDPACQKSYPRDGYNILVSERDVEAAIERGLEGVPQ